MINFNKYETRKDDDGNDYKVEVNKLTHNPNMLIKLKGCGFTEGKKYEKALNAISGAELYKKMMAESISKLLEINGGGLKPSDLEDITKSVDKTFYEKFRKHVSGDGKHYS